MHNNYEPRILLDKPLDQCLIDMSEGRPGALSALIAVLKVGHAVDPDNAFGGFSVLMTFDNAGIYGSDIWVLYNDVCNQSATRLIALARSAQLGFCSYQELRSFVQASFSVDQARIDELIAAVRERLPEFRQTDD